MVSNAIWIFHARLTTHDIKIYLLNYGIEYLGLGKVMWYQQKVSTQITRLTSAYLHG